MAIYIEPNDGPGYVNAGESAQWTINLWDFDNDQFVKSAIKTLTLRLTDEAGSVINGRTATNVLDNDIGTLASDGTLTLKTNATDNGYQGDSDTVEESHFMLITWTWDDEDSVEQTGSELFEYTVRKAPGV